MDLTGISTEALTTGLQNLGLSDEDIAGIGATEAPSETPAPTAAPLPTEAPTLAPTAAPVADGISQAEIQARQDAAYWRGRAERAESTATAAPAATEPPATPQEQIKYLRQAKVLLAQKLQDNEIDHVQHAQQTALIDEKIDEIGYAAINGMVTDTKRAAKAETHQELTAAQAREQYAQIAEQFPVCKLLSEAAFREFIPQAEAQLAAQGIRLTRDAEGNIPYDQTIALSRIMAPLAQAKYGPLLGVSATAAPTVTPAPTAAPTLADAMAYLSRGEAVPEHLRPLVQNAMTGATAPPTATATPTPRPGMPPDITGVGETNLGVIEGGLNEKTVTQLMSEGRYDAITALVAKDPAAAERYAYGG